LVLTDSKNSTKSGKYNEILGSYDARKKTDLLKSDRISYWLGKGIAVTGTVHNLLVSHKLIDAKKINVLPKKTAPVKAAVEEDKAPVAPKEEPAEVEKVADEAPVETATVVEAEPVTESNPVVEAPTEESLSPDAPVEEETKAE
jgi:ribosomal protein S16